MAMLLPAVSFLSAEQSSAKVCVLPSQIFQKGMKDTSKKYVTTLQTILYANSYTNTKPTGVFGLSTKSAVEKLQREKGLKATGVTGPYTIKELNALGCFGKPSNSSPSAVSKGSKATTDQSFTPENNPTKFTDTQLANFKKDIELFLCSGEKVAGVTSATKEEQKSMDAIFLKDLGIKSNLSSGNFSEAGVFLIPEVNKALTEAKSSDMCRHQKIIAVVKDPTSKLRISNLNYTKISAADISSYKDKVLSFNVSDESLAKRFCTKVTSIDKDGKNFSDPNAYCNPYLSTEKGFYGDQDFFHNFSGYFSSEHFYQDGIDHIQVDLYLLENGGEDKGNFSSYKGSLESNHLVLTITK